MVAAFRLPDEAMTNIEREAPRKVSGIVRFRDKHQNRPTPHLGRTRSLGHVLSPAAALDFRAAAGLAGFDRDLARTRRYFTVAVCDRGGRP